MADRIQWSGSQLVGNQAGGAALLSGLGPVPGSAYVAGILALSGVADPNGIGNTGAVNAAIEFEDNTGTFLSWELRWGSFLSGFPFSVTVGFNSATIGDATSTDPNIWFSGNGGTDPLSWFNARGGNTVKALIDSYSAPGGNFPLQFKTITIDLLTASDVAARPGVDFRGLPEMACLVLKGGAYLSIGANTLPAAIQVDLGTTEAQFLCLSPGMYNSGGTALNGGLGIRIYKGKLLSDSGNTPQWHTGYASLGVPVYTQVASLLNPVIPWSGPMQFVVELYSTGNIPANSAFDMTVQGYDLQ